MLTLRARLFIIISVAVLVILGIVILLLVAFKNKTTPTENVNTATPDYSNGVNPVGSGLPAGVKEGDFSKVKISTEGTEEAQKNAAKQMAKIFIERYSSYSTENNGQNIRDLESFVTPEIWQVISKNLNRASTSKESIAVVTEVIAMNLTSWNALSAKVELMAQRTEARVTGEVKTQQNYAVELVKTGGNWLVSKFETIK